MLDDQFRIDFYHQYIGQMKRAMDEGVNVKAYTAWSLVDNFEWSNGYSERFGLHWTNFTDPDRAIYPKASAAWFGQLAQSNKLESFTAVDEDSNPDNESGAAEALSLAALTTWLIMLLC